MNSRCFGVLISTAVKLFIVIDLIFTANIFPQDLIMLILLAFAILIDAVIEWRNYVKLYEAEEKLLELDI